MKRQTFDRKEFAAVVREFSELSGWTLEWISYVAGYNRRYLKAALANRSKFTERLAHQVADAMLKLESEVAR